MSVLGATRPRQSLKLNFIMNIILTVSTIVFPLITFPYVSRILGPSGLGKINFTQAFIAYFAMFAMLGIPVYALRFCAKIRDDKKALSHAAQEFLILSAIFTVIVFGALAVSFVFVEKIRLEWVLTLVVSSSILLNTLSLSWLYSALEKYVFIAVRSIAFNVVSIIAMFIFVRNEQHYIIYAAISVIASAGSSILNLIYARKLISFKKTEKYNFKRHMKPILIFFLLAATVSIYTNMDKLMLGFMIKDNDVSVGLYNAAVKIYHILLSIVTALGVVMLPRMSYYYQNKRYAEFRALIKKAVNLVFIFSLPLIIFFIFYARDAVLLFAGSQYEAAILPLQIILPAILFVAISNITGIQILVPMGKELLVCLSTLIGAVVNLIINIILIPYLGVIATAISLIVAEIVVTGVQFIFIKDYRLLLLKSIHMVKLLTLGGVVAGAVYLTTLIPLSSFFRLAIGGIVMAVVTFLVLFLFKEPMLNEILKKIFKRKTHDKKEEDMKITQTELEGVYVIEPQVFGDSRGWFMETFRADKLRNAGLDIQFVQDNQSYSAQKGTLRGIHFQNYPYAQSKLVRCVKGEILDIAVDLREWSANYKKWVGVTLSAENKKQLLIPKGFGHAFLTLTDDAEVAYKVDEYYNKGADGAIRFDDADIHIDWGEAEPILSDKDKAAPLLKDSAHNFGARVLVTGAKGQLGYDVCKLLKQCGIEHTGADIDDFDLVDEAAVKSFVENYKPTVIVHCAAYTAVDKAEEQQEACRAVNVDGTKYLAAAAQSTEAKFLYVSTDYVYAGKGKKPHKETDLTAPLNVYGKSKLDGEQEVVKLIKHFIVRTSWVFGKNGGNFVKTMLRLGKEKPQLNIVSDQVGSPSYTPDLAQLIVSMIFTEKYGIYNVSNEGCCSWKEFAEAIFQKASMKVEVNAVTSAEYPAKAVRPLNSRLDKAKLEQNGFSKLPAWEDALERFLKEIE
ncbi:MAG: dTDP-4-dehydrorhamnose reductase [Firmicutes bacterium]|nr:dTDP-4-dehydrorhamnose reductase [Bacillota bacterium]